MLRVFAPLDTLGNVKRYLHKCKQMLIAIYKQMLNFPTTP